tara:strand:+ start:720 stop:1121 length:402 start_codon:yes stop_codon:yes gene_type:complete
MESEIWMSFQTSRGANATLFLGVVIAVWVAARFASVSMDKGANAVGKVIVSLFALSVFAAGWNMFTYIGNQFVGHAVAFQGLKNSGVEISPLAQGFIDTYGTEALTMPNMIGAAFLIAGLLIAVLPMWVKTTD